MPTGSEGIMRYDERDDGELLELAASGWAPAFAVLVHRHAPALLTAFADDPDPFERVTDVFLRAMRELPDGAPAGAVTTWLFALAGRPVPEHVPAVREETLDPIWRELSIRWPDGRHVHRPRPVARRLAVIGGALAVGVLVPLVVLGLPAAPDDAIESVRAQPLEDEPTEDREPEDIPSFEFPDVTPGVAQAPTDAPDDEPPAPVAPPTTDTATPVAPEPEPEPEATEDPVPEPVDPVEPVEPIDPPPTGDGGTTDGAADGGASDGDASDGGAGSDGAGSDGGASDGSDGGGTSDGSETLPVIGGDA